MTPAPRIAVFGPHPLLTVTVTVEARGAGDDIHLHAGGQGVWVARMAGELGAAPVLCGFCGGETGAVLRGLLADGPGERRLVTTASASGSYVVDRRSGQRRVVAHAPSDPPSRHEADDLVAVATAAALESELLVVCNPYPGDALELELFAQLVTDARANGTPVLADLSSPRMDSALQGGLALAKLNDWELAEYVSGPVDGPLLLEAARRLRDAGAERVLVTRGPEPALWLDGDEPHWIVPPRFDRGAREGCGDSMLGGIAAALATGADWPEALRIGAGAGAANFLRRGLGTGRAELVARLADRVEMRGYAEAA